jgi:hypothetical protein
MLLGNMSIAVAEAQGQFRNLEREHQLLEAVTRELVKTQLTEKTKCVL